MAPNLPSASGPNSTIFSSHYYYFLLIKFSLASRGKTRYLCLPSNFSPSSLRRWTPPIPRRLRVNSPPGIPQGSCQARPLLGPRPMPQVGPTSIPLPSLNQTPLKQPSLGQKIVLRPFLCVLPPSRLQLWGATSQNSPLANL